jgi:hypothetical protein
VVHNADFLVAKEERLKRDIFQRQEAVGQVIKLTTVMTITAVIE